MRQIGTFSHEEEAKKLSHYLNAEKIGNNIEPGFDAATGHTDYQIWIRDEDQIERAEKILEEFRKNPNDSKFDAPPPEPEPLPEYNGPKGPPVHQFGKHVTHFLIGLCALLFFINFLQLSEMKRLGFSPQKINMTPLMAQTMYDLPPSFEKVEEIIRENEVEGKKLKEIPYKVDIAVAKANEMPYFQGLYGWVLAKIKGEDTSEVEGPLFIQIRKGELWRLFTPCLMHKDLLHILFNMLWLWYLGRPIEQRIGPFRMSIFTIIAGVGSNTLQYFMSGPFFLGYSGVVMALAGFIWMREKIAPWEGYPLNRSTILFIIFFVVAIFGLQVASFFFEIFSSYQFALNIANAAHISGAIIGVILARFRFFAQRVKHERT